MIFRNRFVPTRIMVCDPPDPPGLAPPAPAPAPPAPPAPALAAPPAPPAPAPATDPTARIRQLESQIADVRAEAASHRIGEREARGQVDALQTQLTEARGAVEAARAQERTGHQQREAAMSDRLIDAELRAAALASGLEDPDLVGLMERTGITIDPTTQAITGIPEAIAKFKLAKPVYFRTGAPAPAAPRSIGPAGPAPAPAPGGPGPANVRALDKPGYRAAKAAGLAALRTR